MNFIFSWQKQYFNIVLPLENKIHIFAPPCNILYVNSSYTPAKGHDVFIFRQGNSLTPLLSETMTNTWNI